MSFAPSQNPLIGELDARSRPVVEVELQAAGTTYTIQATIDTGCDDALIFTDYNEAISHGLRFGIAQTSLRHDRFFADGRFGTFVEARGTLNWFGPRFVRVLAPDPRPRDGQPPPLPLGFPRILLGLRLLNGCSLRIRFARGPGTVMVEPPTETSAGS